MHLKVLSKKIGYKHRHHQKSTILVYISAVCFPLLWCLQLRVCLVKYDASLQIFLQVAGEASRCEGQETRRRVGEEPSTTHLQHAGAKCQRSHVKPKLAGGFPREESDFATMGDKPVSE